MTRKKDIRLSSGQLEVMQALWPRGEASTADVHAVLAAERGLAYTTVATLLKRLEARGAVTSRRVGRELVFRATVSEADVRKSMVTDLVATLFRGDPNALVTHLVKESEIDAGDLDKVRRLLQNEEHEHE